VRQVPLGDVIEVQDTVNAGSVSQTDHRGSDCRGIPMVRDGILTQLQDDGQAHALGTPDNSLSVFQSDDVEGG
jgi:hypothetical protein